HHRPMVWHEPLGIPARRKNCLVHRPPAWWLPLPYLEGIDPLQRLMGTQDQPCHIATDMLKTLIPAKQLSVLHHALPDRLRHPTDWQHSSGALLSALLPFFILLWGSFCH